MTRNLRFLRGAGYTLDGTYVQALNDDTGEAFNTSSQFFYSPSNTHFDEVNVYYHLTEFAASLPNATFPGIGYTILAKLHYGTNWGNASFSPSAQELRFGDGGGVYFSSSPNLSQGRDAMIQADNLLYAGANVCDIRQAFAARDLGTSCAPPTPDLQASIEGPDFVTHKNNETFEAIYSGGSGTPSFQWYYRTLGSSSWTNTNVTSNTYSRFIYPSHPDFELRVDVTRGSEPVTATHTVYYFGGGGGGGDDPPCGPAGCAFAESNSSSLSATASAELVFELGTSYPNPAAGKTTIPFSTDIEGTVTLVIYDALGREVLRPVDRELSAGAHETQVDLSTLSPGVYLYRLSSADRSESRRLMVTR